MVNPDNLALKIAELADSGKVQGISDVRDDSSGRTGQRLVVVLRRDAVARVVLNNLLKHTELQTNFSANMLALVDGVPRTLTVDQFISNWVTHQIEVIQRRTRFRLRRGRAAGPRLRGLVKALDALDEVIALIRRSPDVDEARDGPDGAARDRRDPGDRPSSTCSCAAWPPCERQKIIDRPGRARARSSPTSRTSSPTRPGSGRSSATSSPRSSRSTATSAATQIIAADGDLSMEDLIPDEDLVVSITRGGYAKRTRADQYRTQKRGGKGVRGASLRGDDVVEHFIATTNHHWLLFFTTAGRVYRTKAYNLPEAQRDAKGGHVAGLLSFQPDESIAQVLAIRDYEQAPYLVLATRNGLVKKTRLGDYNSPRQAGVIAINFREDDDELIGAELVNADDDILLVSRKGQAIRFRADDSQLRPMGRATSGVAGMKFRGGDSLLSMSVIRAAQVAAEEAAEAGHPRPRAARSDGRQADLAGEVSSTSSPSPTAGSPSAPGSPTTACSRAAASGIKAMSLANEDRGGLVGAFIVEDGDEVLSITNNGQVVRSPINADFRPTGRSTMGVKFVTPKNGDAVAVVARSVEAKEVDEEPVERGRRGRARSTRDVVAGRQQLGDRGRDGDGCRRTETADESPRMTIVGRRRPGG